MCIEKNLGEAALKRYRAKGKNGYIRVWKVVIEQSGYYIALLQHNNSRKRYKKGLCHAYEKAKEENELIYACRDKKSARQWSGTTIECLVKPEWVKAVGISFRNRYLNLTTKAIVMPEFPKTKVTVREFREAIKGKKVKTYSWE